MTEPDRPRFARDPRLMIERRLGAGRTADAWAAVLGLALSGLAGIAAYVLLH